MSHQSCLIIPTRSQNFFPMDNNYDDLSKNEKKLLLIHYALMVADNFLCKDMKKRDDVI